MVVCDLLVSLLNHSDRVRVACQAQLVNVIGLLRSEPGGEAWKQTIAYPFEQMARLMKWGGRLMPIGFTSGQIPSLPMNLPLLKNYSIVGVFAGVWAEKFPEQAVRMNDTLAQLLAEVKIRPHIDRVLPLEQVKEAMRAVANRTVQGRIVLKIR